MLSSKSFIGNGIHWQRLVNELNISSDHDITANTSLPCQIYCPSCMSANCKIYHDNITMSEWYFCDSCKCSGDLIQLAAKTLNLDISTTIYALSNLDLFDKLSDKPDFVTINEYRNDFIDIHENISKTLSLPIMAENATEELLIKAGLQQVPEKVWSELFKIVRIDHLNDQLDKHDITKLFKGIEKDDIPKYLFTIPFYDIKGRVRSLYAVPVRNNEYIKQLYPKISASGLSSTTDKVKYHDIGVGMLPAADYVSKEYDDSLFCTTDPVLGSKLQIKHLQEYRTPLPLVCTYDSPKMISKSGWENITRNKIILHLKEINAQSLSLARYLNAKIFYPTSRKKDPYISFKDCKPFAWLTMWYKHAKDWEEVIEEKLASLPTKQANEFLADLELGLTDGAKFLSQCSLETREQLSKTNSDKDQKIIIIKGKIIVEHNNMWYINDTKIKNLVSNYTVKLDNITKIKGKKIYYYKGNIIGPDISLPFSFSSSSATHVKLEDKVNEILFSTGRPPLGFRSVKPATLLDIAIGFSRPKTEELDICVGWNTEKACFLLPKLIIQANQDKFLPSNMVDILQDLPGESLTDDTQIMLSEINQLEENPSIWPMLATFISCILAPSRNKKAQSITIDSTYLLQPMITLGAILACKQLSTRQAEKEIIHTTVDMYTRHPVLENHNWPLLINLVETPSHKVTNYLNTISVPNCVILNSRMKALVTVLKKQYDVMVADEFVNIGISSNTVSKVVANYLRWFCSHHQQLPQVTGNLQRVKVDMLEWFGSIGGKYQADNKVLIFDKDEQNFGRALKILLILLYKSRQLRLIPITKGIFIPTLLLVNAMESQKIYSLNHRGFVDNLKEEGLLVQEDYNGMTGVVVPNEYLQITF